MSHSGALFRTFLFAVLALVGCWAVYVLFVCRATPDRRVEAPRLSFSPDTDLEASDIAILESARVSVDITMYTFTDRRIANELSSLGSRGVKVRIYLDGEQSSAEEAKAARHRSESVVQYLRAMPNVQIKIKRGPPIMHLKAYCVDEATLRAGSANWSESGEQEQDNDMYVLNDRESAAKFEGEFQKLWDRADNRIP